ncbi:hypothetical protein P409_25250 [Inquilinus limosus MP06]|uniref:Uncharacterized protein n=2 Tax=Inquilinus limosus TaxID=171674 RepID=A0A0A0D3X5_9PROT|nr:hypothetical protein P409_25250 [Inquilinus limosus MP06]
MMRGFRVRAAGLFVLAALCLPVQAAQPVTDVGSDTPIRFVSGPFAGVAVRSATHSDEPLDANTPYAQDDARFEAGGLRLSIHWARLGRGHAWKLAADPALLDTWVETLRKTNGGLTTIVLESSRDPVSGLPAVTKTVVYTGADRRCGVFVMGREGNRINGYLCGAASQAIPLRATLQGLSIAGVTGP